MVLAGRCIVFSTGTRIAGLRDSGAIIAFWGFFAKVIKALLTNELVLACRTFAAVLGILDHGLETAGQKVGPL
jgi:hypothetical protein